MLHSSPAGSDAFTQDKTARQLASLLPRVMRSLFGGDDDPAAALPLAQLKVCGILSEGPRSMSALSSELGVTLSAMTQIANRLERARLVMRVAEEGDRRVRLLSLTARAAKMMQKRREERVHRMTNVLEHVASEERDHLIAGLQALLHACCVARGDETCDGGMHDGAAAIDNKPHLMKTDHVPADAMQATQVDHNFHHR